MDLVKTQQVLAKLYTEAAFRERFFRDPEAACEEAGLAAAAAGQLAGLAPSKVRFFADSLVRKRLREVRKLLPLAVSAYGRRFDQLFEQYAATHGLKTPKPHQQDAIGFAAYLRQAILSAGREPKWAAELARYEAAWLEASDPQRRLTVRLLRCPVALLAPPGNRGQEAPRSAGRATLAIWFRLRRTAPLRHLLQSLSILSFLGQFRRLLRAGARTAEHPGHGWPLQASVGEIPASPTVDSSGRVSSRAGRQAGGKSSQRCATTNLLQENASHSILTRNE